MKKKIKKRRWRRYFKMNNNQIPNAGFEKDRIWSDSHSPFFLQTSQCWCLFVGEKFDILRERTREMQCMLYKTSHIYTSNWIGHCRIGLSSGRKQQFQKYVCPVGLTLHIYTCGCIYYIHFVYFFFNFWQH